MPVILVTNQTAMISSLLHSSKPSLLDPFIPDEHKCIYCFKRKLTNFTIYSLTDIQLLLVNCTYLPLFHSRHCHEHHVWEIKLETIWSKISRLNWWFLMDLKYKGAKLFNFELNHWKYFLFKSSNGCSYEHLQWPF